MPSEVFHPCRFLISSEAPTGRLGWGWEGRPGGSQSLRGAQLCQPAGGPSSAGSSWAGCHLPPTVSSGASVKYEFVWSHISAARREVFVPSATVPASVAFVLPVYAGSVSNQALSSGAVTQLVGDRSGDAVGRIRNRDPGSLPRAPSQVVSVRFCPTRSSSIGGFSKSVCFPIPLGMIF